MTNFLLLASILFGWIFTNFQAPNAQTQPKAVVKAILFYSPSCPHCYQVITQDLPPILEKYGEQLQIIGVDSSTEDGHQLFEAAITRFAVPPERQGVPFLVIGDAILVGSLEIPQQLPTLVEQYLAQGGLDWPDIPGFQAALAEAETQATEQETIESTPTTAANPGAVSSPTDEPVANLPAEASSGSVADNVEKENTGLILEEETNTSLIERLERDPGGNTLAIFALVGMLVILGSVVSNLANRRNVKRANPVAAPLSIAIPILSLIGLGVAGYLAYVETTQSTAICGPVGDCNTVQQSPYAVLFGLLPVGVLGIIGYLAIILAWLVGRFAEARLASWATLALFGMSLFGVIFSIYLTFLEPFVIGATCAWCVTSALVMTALLWLSAGPAKESWFRVRGTLNGKS